MAICLSHKSAEKYLENLAHEGESLINELEPVSGSCIHSMTSNDREIRKLLGQEMRTLKPVEVIVGFPDKCHSSSDVVAHLWSGFIPDGAILRHRDGLYVSSPEFCLVQQARMLHTVNLCQLLGQFLATASPHGTVENRTLKKRSPLTNFSRIEDFLRDARRPYGAKRLREAMRYTLAGAASPQETKLQLVFSLPYAYYGFGFKGIELNHCIDLTSASRELCDSGQLFVDLYFGKPRPFKGEDESALRAFGLEYQGEEFHQDPSRDASRFLAAHAENVDLWYVAQKQIESAEALNYIALEVARRMRRKVNPKSWPTIKELEGLLEILNGDVTPKPGQRQRKRTSMARRKV